MTLAEINRRIRLVEPGVELVRGEGYHYYTFTHEGPPLIYETESVYMPYTKQRSARRWIEGGIEFAHHTRRERGI